MMNFMQKQTQNKYLASLIACTILYTGILCNRAKHRTESCVDKKSLEQKPLSYEERQKIALALDSALVSAHELGKWFEDLFDIENNISYVEHVKNFKKTMTNVQQNFVMPLTPDENTHVTVKTAHHLALLLLQQVESTYAVLKNYRGSGHPFWLGRALQKVLDSSRYKAAFDEVIEEFHEQLAIAAPDLGTKLGEFKATIKFYGDRINNQSSTTLLKSLWHRLGCK